jgi:hypothetical protein
LNGVEFKGEPLMTPSGTLDRRSNDLVAQSQRNRLPSSPLWRSTMAVVATIPLFCLPYNIAVNFLAPLLVLCLALATIWRLPGLGWAVIAMIAGIAIAAMFNGLTLMLSLFGEGLSNRVLKGADWAMLTAALAGAGYLVWLSVACLRGRFPPPINH